MPRAGEYEAQRRYEELSRFYVVANRYEQDTTIGDHTDSNPLYAVPHPKKQQVVISCSTVADGVLWISPTKMPACRMRQATGPWVG